MAVWQSQMTAGGLVVVLLLVTPAFSLDNGLGLTPPMGFNPWNCYGIESTGLPKLPGSKIVGFNETVIKAVADAFVTLGLKEAGYEYVNLDCGYSTGFRDAQGQLVVNTSLYPSGLKALGDYIHDKGLKFGLYSDAGAVQCCSRIWPGANDGSLGHEAADAAWFASLGIDYLKHDNCNPGPSSYPDMRDALNKTGRPIYYSIHGPIANDSLANCWRTTTDINPNWDSFYQRAHENNQYIAAARPGAFNDADMLEVGNAPLTMAENRAHFSLWCLMKAPLLIGTDLVANPPSRSVLEILTNKDAIAINQDPLGQQGRFQNATADGCEVWSGALADGDTAAIILNVQNSTVTCNAPLSMIPGLNLTQDMSVRDIWSGQTVSLPAGSKTWKVTLDSHDVAFLRFTKA
ncbi:uncharacterized protein MONBRDRAFT_34585 [Monosiga brevicollis MX1]|uniref:Alpha-galactosidase n=1 Tax=Monosiga brevicollis TaxID=81824 RepID=A9VCP1_MONBE|nr:uncharacterized protein MONBRDRAFT_34585 [Monosiga brevicollis MX1]EDQ84720.1 predicted protein [Monosiga brevicollis MX1]|eukprot:XP_001750506.1 hypothetical protein [Monosiga brevicollis MX1]